MFENNPDFYPTPPELISKMLSKFNFKNKNVTILEPSAGSGNLAEAIVNKIVDNQYSKSKYDLEEEKKKRIKSAMQKVDCIEIDVNLRYILNGKGYKVIHDDFLTYDGMKRFSGIIANFPFSCGDKHLIHALELIESNSGHLICLVNKNTLTNPYSNNRKSLLQKLEEMNAEIEYLEGEFKDADRKSNVIVALISVKVENTNNKESIIIENLKKEELYSKKVYGNTNSVISGDFITGIVEQYAFEIKTGIELINEYNKIKPMMLKTFNAKCEESILRLCINDRNGFQQYSEPSPIEMINEYIRCVRLKYWDTLFNSKEFTSMLTSNLRNELIGMIEKLADYDFSKYNIKEIQMQMNNNLIRAVEDTILSLFDEFSAKHSCEDFSKNIHMFNGWKHNACWKINKKIVTTINGYYDMQYSWGRFSPTRILSKLQDIEKVLNYLDGGKTEEIDLEKVIKEAETNEKTKDIELKYVILKFYKKGTCHILFKDEELLQRFNLFGCMKKGFLPPSYGKANYTDMTKEEADVIDEFEGRESYNKVMGNLDYYLYNPSKVLQIEG